MNDNVTVIIRSVGERTEQLCKKLILEQGVPEEQVIIIRESPFTEALRKSFHLGIEKGKKWTLCVDADVLLRPNSIANMIEEFENQPENVCEIQGYILDKFFGGPREGGIHVYRTSLLNNMLTHLPPYHAIRPESTTLKIMSSSGYPFIKIPYLIGLHDFEQYYKDIFRKCFVQAHKHLYKSELFLTIFREGMQKDPDLKVALDGFVSGLYYKDEVKIDIEQSIYHTSFSKFKVDEKSPLPVEKWSLESVENTIKQWNESPIFKKQSKTTVENLEAQYVKHLAERKGLSTSQQKIVREKKNLGIFGMLSYSIGWLLTRTGNFFIRVSGKKFELKRKKRMSIAFITNEFVIETEQAGGLGNYLNRITRILHNQGHRVEIFVTRKNPQTPRIVDYQGIRVEHVDAQKGLIFQVINLIDRLFLRSPWNLAAYFSRPWSLASALEKRHAESPFDFIQSTNLSASGLFVRKPPERPLIVRLSSIRELAFESDGRMGNLGAKIIVWLERAAVNRSDLIYAPSQFSANYYEKTNKRKVHVLRPPMFVEQEIADTVPFDVPPRFLIHFGSIGPVKGSDWLAEALLLAWEKNPDFKMIWAGKERIPGEMEKYRQLWGQYADNIIWHGPIEKKVLYALIKKSTASVLPSRVDNLPNTVIESLMLGVPAIGSNGASLDELIEPGKSGALINIGDIHSLANVMLDAWNGNAPWLGDGFDTPAILSELNPDTAAENLLKLATNGLTVNIS